MKRTPQEKVTGSSLLVHRQKQTVATMNHELITNNQRGFSSLAFLTVLGLIMAITLTLVGTGAIKLPGNTKIPVSPIPISDPVEDDAACNDPYNADCENFVQDPEDLTPQQIQKILEEN